MSNKLVLVPGKKYVRSDGEIVTLKYRMYPFIGSNSAGISTCYSVDGESDATPTTRLIRECPEPRVYYKIIDLAGVHDFTGLHTQATSATLEAEEFKCKVNPGLKYKIIKLIEDVES